MSILPWLILLPALRPARAALSVPAGTRVEIRLTTRVASNSSKVGDAVEAAVIAPVIANGALAIPAGAIARGTVAAVHASTRTDERAQMELSFTSLEIDGTAHALTARLVDIDNARERINDKGQIDGILASETLSARLDSGIEKVAERYSGLAGVLGAAKKAVLKSPEADIVYEPGVEMTLELTGALALDHSPNPGPAGAVRAIDDKKLLALVVAQPFQTRAQHPPQPSDITNMALIGTQEQVEAAFAAAGWSTAAALSVQSKMETVRAVAEQRGYKEAPVSILLLEDRPPGMVFQKQNNTFARRHHLRVWRRPQTWDGRPLWVVAATHDTGISFSEQNRTFIHRIDSQIDHERAKVMNDLIFGGHVAQLALVERPSVPRKGANATGDALETDGRIAVLVLK